MAVATLNWTTTDISAFICWHIVFIVGYGGLGAAGGVGGLGGAGGGLGGLGGGAGSPFGTGKVLFVALPFKIIYNKANSLNSLLYLPLFQCPEGFGTGALGGQGYQPGELLCP